jgi:hypothetical protein
VAEPETESAIGKGFASALGAAAGGLVTWLTTGSLGPAIAALAALFGAVVGLCFSLRL